MAVGYGQPVAGVHGEEPQLVEARRVESAQNLVVAFGVRLAVARGDFAEGARLLVPERIQVPAQQRKPVYVPVVFNRGDGRLQQDANGSLHAITVPGYKNYPPGVLYNSLSRRRCRS